MRTCLAALAIALSSTTAMATTSVAGPPVIREPLTLLPCPASPVSTIAIEGCQEHALLRLDGKIDTEVKTIYGLLSRTRGRAELVTGERGWLTYRRSSCAAEAAAMRAAASSHSCSATARCAGARRTWQS